MHNTTPRNTRTNTATLVATNVAGVTRSGKRVRAQRAPHGTTVGATLHAYGRTGTVVGNTVRHGIKAMAVAMPAKGNLPATTLYVVPPRPTA